MSIVESEQNLMMENLLSLRKKVTQYGMNEELNKIAQWLQSVDLQKNGPLVTATHGIDMVNGEYIIDTEILVPLSRKTDVPEGYQFKEKFHLKHALRTQHKGNPVLIQNTYNMLAQYIVANGLQQITNGYNVHVTEMQPGQSPDDMLIDIYIGINPSIL